MIILYSCRLVIYVFYLEVYIYVILRLWAFVSEAFGSGVRLYCLLFAVCCAALQLQLLLPPLLLLTVGWKAAGNRPRENGSLECQENRITAPAMIVGPRAEGGWATT